MKAKQRDGDWVAEFAVWANGAPCRERVLPKVLDGSAFSANTISCFVDVEDGDNLTVEGHFSGSVSSARFDLLADGSFLRDKLLGSPHKTDLQVYERKELHFTEVYDTLPSDVGSKPRIVEGRMHARAFPSMEYNPRGIGSDLGVGSLAIIVSINGVKTEKHRGEHLSCKAGSWMSRDVTKTQEAGISPTFDIKVESTKTNVEKLKQERHLRHSAAPRFGYAPWVRFVFYYRLRRDIAAAGCIPMAADAIDIPLAPPSKSQKPVKAHKSDGPAKPSASPVAGKPPGRPSRIGQPLNFPRKGEASRSVPLPSRPSSSQGSRPGTQEPVDPLWTSQLASSPVLQQQTVGLGQDAVSAAGGSNNGSLFGDGPSPKASGFPDYMADDDQGRQDTAPRMRGPVDSGDAHDVRIAEANSIERPTAQETENSEHVEDAMDSGFNVDDYDFGDFSNEPVKWDDSAADIFSNLQVPDGMRPSEDSNAFASQATHFAAETAVDMQFLQPPLELSQLVPGSQDMTDMERSLNSQAQDSISDMPGVLHDAFAANNSSTQDTTPQSNSEEQDNMPSNNQHQYYPQRGTPTKKQPQWTRKNFRTGSDVINATTAPEQHRKSDSGPPTSPKAPPAPMGNGKGISFAKHREGTQEVHGIVSATQTSTATPPAKATTADHKSRSNDRQSSCATSPGTGMASNTGTTRAVPPFTPARPSPSNSTAAATGASTSCQSSKRSATPSASDASPSKKLKPDPALVAYLEQLKREKAERVARRANNPKKIEHDYWIAKVEESSARKKERQAKADREVRAETEALKAEAQHADRQDEEEDADWDRQIQALKERYAADREDLPDSEQGAEDEEGEVR